MKFAGFRIFDAMRIPAILGIIMVLAACSKEAKKDVLLMDYIKAGIPASAYRTYVHNTDTSQIKVLLKQSSKVINDTTIEITTFWMNTDSIPINLAVERWFTNNTLQLLKQSIYEPIGPEKVLELKGNFDTTKIISLLNNNTNMSFSFRGIVDTAYFLTINATSVAKLDSIKNLDGILVSGLSISNNETMSLNFIDNRKDTVIKSTTTRYYTLEQGLIYMETISNPDTLRFYLVKD